VSGWVCFRAVPRVLRPTLLVLIVVAACAALVAGCGGNSGNDAGIPDGSGSTQADTTSTQADTTTTPAGTSTTATGAGGCKKVAKPAPKAQPHLPKPTLTLDASKQWTATVTTNCGTFTIVLDVKRAPKTSASFASLAQKGFFNDLIFHRIVPGFVIQGGDPLGNGTGGPGYRVVEAPPKNLQYTHGIVSMAKAGNEPSGASGSQFFVVLGDNVGLPAEYALVGKVTKGLGVVDKIGAVPLDPNGDGSTSVDPVVIQSVKVSSH
jgi:peptidyl-prolyl cis-trans isomerase B (cyclophilin B)